MPTDIEPIPDSLQAADYFAAVDWGPPRGPTFDPTLQGQDQPVHFSRLRPWLENPRLELTEMVGMVASQDQHGVEKVLEAFVGDDPSLLAVEDGHRRLGGFVYRVRRETAAGRPEPNDGVLIVKVVPRREPVDVLAKQLRNAGETAAIGVMDEAAGFERMRVQYALDTAAAVAKKLGGKFTVDYVQGRLRLLNLLPTLQEHVRTKRLALGHAIQIGRLPHEHQNDAVKMLRAGQVPGGADKLATWITVLLDTRTAPKPAVEAGSELAEVPAPPAPKGPGSGIVAIMPPFVHVVPHGELVDETADPTETGGGGGSKGKAPPTFSVLLTGSGAVTSSEEGASAAVYITGTVVRVELAGLQLGDDTPARVPDLLRAIADKVASAPPA